VEQAAAEIGHGALTVAGDVANLDDLDRLYAELRQRFGRLDIVFANAGMMNIAPIPAVTPEQFDNEFNTNVRGLYFTVQKALPLLCDGGSIILTSSVANHTGSPGYSLRGRQGRGPGVRAELVQRLEGSQDPRQQPQPGTDRDTNGRQDERAAGDRRRQPAFHARAHASRTVGKAARDRNCRAILGERRQLIH
jgi:NAD(P)-dependent dehydrogenase (short-subunit alcohol dehydrogenase family)